MRSFWSLFSDFCRCCKIMVGKFNKLSEFVGQHMRISSKLHNRTTYNTRKFSAVR